jgi:hypothetical protein
MSNILSHEEKPNQNYIEIPSVPSQDGVQQDKKQQQMLVRMQRKRNPHTLLVEM